MSGGSEKQVNGWTLAQLKEYLERMIVSGDEKAAAVADERNARYDSRATQADEAIKVGRAEAKEALFTALNAADRVRIDAEKAHQDVHGSAAKALALATTEMKEKLQEMNALRQQITAERSTYVTRDILDARMLAVNADLGTRLKTLEDARGRQEGRGSGYGASWQVAISVCAILFGLASLLFTVLR